MSEMTQRLAKWEDGDVLKLPQFVRFNPLDFPICTKTPLRFNVLSAWMGHVPFAMALMEMVKPRILVELGTHWGVSYCAFCQAIKELRLATQCFAVDTWQGDPHASFYTNEVLDNLKDHHDERYSLFSKLLRCTFDEALTHFEDKSVDVLHIDGYHTYEAAKHDFETWLPKMSERGVVLIHDIEVRDRETFGVWRFWDEIKQKYPSFAFYHSHGLGVLAVGETVPDGLRVLVSGGPAEAERIRTYFANLGNHLDELHSAALQKENLSELVQVKADECQKLIDELTHLLGVQAYYTQLRFRLVDHAARRMKHVPVIYQPIRLAARGLLRLVRKIKHRIKPVRTEEGEETKESTARAA